MCRQRQLRRHGAGNRFLEEEKRAGGVGRRQAQGCDLPAELAARLLPGLRRHTLPPAPGHAAAGQSAHHVVASLTTTTDTGRPVASRNPANISPAATSSATGSSPPEPSRARVLTSASDRPPAAIKRLPITRPGTISFRQSNQDEYSAPPIRVKVP